MIHKIKFYNLFIYICIQDNNYSSYPQIVNKKEGEKSGNKSCGKLNAETKKVVVVDASSKKIVVVDAF